ncbi:putative phage abortive infection protein [Halobacillus sp. SY10]|uniref:putative phage abortive infection protein n=1 Tax=Halobacillus sp. SY10 TaxID=3381356 RepID=UPI00387A39A5
MEKDKKDKTLWFYSGVVTLFFAVIIPFFIMVLASKGFTVSQLQSLGPVGDFFGGSTIGLLSIASIFFIIHTITVQSKELELQREELKNSIVVLELQKNELEDTKKEFIEQNRTMNIQRFENTFFNMMSFLNDITEEFESANENGQLVKGRKAFQFLHDFLFRKYANGSGRINFKNQYENYYTQKQHMFGHYFRHIYRTLKLIDEADVPDKHTYIGILKARLSTYELLFILYNSISKYGEEKMLPLIKKYKLLDNMNENMLITEIDEKRYK